MASRRSLPARTAPKTAPPALVSSSLAALEREIGGRTALVAALSHAPKSQSLDYILGLIGDPARAKSPLADLCALGGITAGELIEAYKSGEINRAQALALQKVGARLPAVAEDTMTRSLPQEIVCPSCDGLGQSTPEPTKKVPNPEPETCKFCKGTGRFVREGDLEHKKLALEMGKLLQKGGGGLSIAVTQNNANFSGGAAGGALEKLQMATDQILYGDGEVDQPIEAEVEEVSEPSAPAAEVEGDWREDLQ